MRIDDFLAPHEYHPGFPPQIVRADENRVWWNGSEKNAITAILEWPLAGRTLHVRFQNDEAGFALSTSTPPNISPDNFAPSPENLARRLHRAIHSARLWRRFSFPAREPEANLTAFVGAGGVSLWGLTLFSRAKQGYQTIQTPVRFVLENVHLLDSPALMQTRIRQALKSELSDAFVAHQRLWSASQWSHKYTPIKRTSTGDHLFGYRDYKEFASLYEKRRRLLELIARAFSPEFESKHNGIAIKTTGLHPEDWRRERIVVWPDTAILRLWGKILVHFGPLHVAPLRFEKYLSVRDLAVSYNQGFYAQFGAVSAHERMEARLGIVEWAKKTLPPDVLREVLEQSE